MRRGIVALLSVALGLGAGAGAPAWASLADRIGATFALMAADFIKAFQPLEGVIVAVDRDALYLDQGEAAGVQVGQEFTIFRRGEPFHHPFTGKRLGRYEEILGWAQVRQVQREFAEAVYVPRPGQSSPRVEDGVRISRGRIRVAVTPVLDLAGGRADLRRVPYLLAAVLERSKRFQIVDTLAVADMFAGGSLRIEEVLARPERAMRVAKNLEVTGWLVPVLLDRRGVLHLDVTWISAITGTALLSRREPLVAESAGEAPRFPWEPRSED